MVAVKAFAIEGLAGRRDPIVEDLNSDMNIFFGVNGSGKTGLLRIVHAALSAEIEPLYGVRLDKAEVTIVNDQSRRTKTQCHVA